MSILEKLHRANGQDAEKRLDEIRAQRAEDLGKFTVIHGQELEEHAAENGVIDPASAHKAEVSTLSQLGPSAENVSSLPPVQDPEASQPSHEEAA